MRRRGRRSRSESRGAGRSSSSRLVSQVERERRDKIEKENQILLKLVYAREYRLMYRGLGFLAERERRDKIEKENQILLKLVYTREY
jgi:hypothetical protein